MVAALVVVLAVTDLPVVPAISTSFGIVVLWTVAWLTITRKLVWHTDLDKCEADRDARLAKVEADRARWEQTALTALGVAEKLTVSAEVTDHVLASLPGAPPVED